jgi:transposase
MNKLSDLSQLTEQQKDLFIIELGEELERAREENSKLKEENSKLKTENEELGEQVKRLEEKLNARSKNSRNSSNPPSQDRKANKPDGENCEENPTRKRRKASVGRKGGGRALHAHPDQIIVAHAKTCPHCGESVETRDQHLHAVYDKIEIPPVKPVVTRVEQYGGHCPHCDKDYVSSVPTGMEPGTPFGESVQSLATYFRYTHAISYERLAQLFGEVYHLDISEGGLANLFHRVKGRFDGRVEEILQRLRSSRLVCSDETGARVNGRNEWEWVFQNKDVCIHVIRSSRGQKVIQEVMGGHRPKIWVSDLYSAQRKNPAEQWQVCLAHQLRDCQYAIEMGDTVFAPRMKIVLLRSFVIHKRRDHLKQNTLYQYRCSLNRRLAQCLELQPINKEGIRLRKRYGQIQKNLFLFLEDATIPPTNNSSEQALRMSKLFRKVTNCFRSTWGRDLFASIRSVVNTGKRQGMTAFDAIKKALSPITSFFAPG